MDNATVLDITLNTTRKNAYPFELKLVLICAMSILLIIGIPTNLLITWTFAVIKRLHIAHNIFVVSLAITDTIIIAYLLPFNLAFVINDTCIIEESFCFANGLIAHICFATSVQTIMHISINRYIKICHRSHHYMKIYKQRNVIFLLILSWSLGPIFAIPILIYPQYIIYDYTLQMCIFDRYSDKVYTNLYQGFCLGLPLAVTTVCYVLIYRHMSKTNAQIAHHWNNGLARERYRHDLNATKAHVTVFIGYLVLYLPFGVIATVFDSGHNIPTSIHALSINLCFLNSCINGLIYGLFNKSMRRAYREALPCFTEVRRVGAEEVVRNRVTGSEYVATSSNKITFLLRSKGVSNENSSSMKYKDEPIEVVHTPIITARESEV